MNETDHFHAEIQVSITHNYLDHHHGASNERV